MAVQADGGVENKIKWVQGRKENDHLPGYKLGFDLVGDPQCSEQADDAVRQGQQGQGPGSACVLRT